ncbi:MAG: hypothetical protein IPM56_11225 [Ignavibacteriales bacterium]|nr:MAG: hypothetical protein IPM56_11225 [Ignavibacteriales bacterium]
MTYENLYSVLKKENEAGNNNFVIGENELHISSVEFVSNSALFNPLNEEKKFGKRLFNSLLNYYLGRNKFSKEYIFNVLNKADETVMENNRFRYFLLGRNELVKSKSVIVLLHGLNERSWDKYLPWAFELHRQTGKSILMFPLAFHMNRAPREWSDPRLMQQVSIERANLLPGIQCSSFANAALSTRIQFLPKRFLLSGLQTFEDINSLISQIRTGNNYLVDKDAEIDFFSYSIGAFLAEILFMCDYNNLYSGSRLFNFCGGSTLDLTMPVSKAIMDSEADTTLKEYYSTEFEKDIERDELLSDRLKQLDDSGLSFMSMLSIEKFKKFREERLSQMKNRLKTLILSKDKVFSPSALLKTFPDNSSGKVLIKDYNYSYTHENPFPLKKEINQIVDFAFSETMSLVSAFLR